MSDEIQRAKSEGRRAPAGGGWMVGALVLVLSFVIHHSSVAAEFTNGVTAFHNGDYAAAAHAFATRAAREPSTGAFQNYGLAEWQRGRKGFAILAWERALWVSLNCC